MFLFSFKDNGSDIKDGEFNNKTAGGRRVDTNRASNPYYQSGHSFPKRTAGAEAQGDIKESGFSPLFCVVTS